MSKNDILRLILLRHIFTELSRLKNHIVIISKIIQQPQKAEPCENLVLKKDKRLSGIFHILKYILPLHTIKESSNTAKICPSLPTCQAIFLKKGVLVKNCLAVCILKSKRFSPITRQKSLLHGFRREV
jgi:hypothetical protein